ncbi:MAG: DNA internalization-related competence protein ComEC/Rec2 [Nitrospinota bacterium]|nr:DNA internalization-related competence protein ComEC/Rec2 [Nitrospinota bacterium]
MAQDIQNVIKARPGMSAVFALATGIALGRFYVLDPAVAGIAAFSVAATIYLAGRRVGALMAVSLVMGALLIIAHDVDDPAQVLARAGLFGKSTSMEVEVVTADSERIRNVRVILLVKNIGGVDVNVRVVGYFRHSHPLAHASPGDVFYIQRAKLLPIHGFRNKGGWDYEQYMRDKGIAGRVIARKTAGTKLIDRKLSVARVMEKARRRAGARLARLIDDQDTLAAAKAMLTGDQGLVNLPLREVFSRGGTAHLLAVSGLHVGFVAGAVFFMFKALLFALIYSVSRRFASAGVPVRLAAILTLPAVWLFVLYTGPPASALRAGIMIGTYLALVALGRPREFYMAFAAAMGVILIMEPGALFTISFQLSFTAVFFITIFLEKYFNSWNADTREDPLRRLAPGWAARAMARFPVLSSALAISVFAVIGSGPLVATHFHTVSLVGPLINAPVVILGSVAVPMGIAGLLLDWAPLIQLSGWLIHLITAITHWAVELPFSFVYLSSAPGAAYAAFYFAVALFIILRPGAARNRRVGVSLLLAVTIAAGGYAARQLEEGMTIRILDVGQSDSALISWPGGVAVVDAGRSSPSFDVGRMVVAPAVWRMGKSGLDAFFATHGDYDHIGGAMGLFDRIPPRAVYFANGPKAKPAMAALRGWAVVRGVYRPLAAGETVKFERGPLITVLNPPRGHLPYPDSSNNRSLVLKVSYGKVSILLSGDIDSTVEKWLVSTGADIRAQVLKIPHHGSATSSSSKFLEAVDPEFAMISVGKGNRHGQPNRNVIQRLENRGVTVFRTDMDGEVTLWTDGVRVEIYTHSGRKGENRLGAEWEIEE